MPAGSLTRGERAADTVARTVGSWRFICVQSFAVVCWISLNLVAWRLRWDPYPFVLLNLAFSTQAAYTGPILQLSGNRQTTKIEQLSEQTHATVAQLLANDALHEQITKNERDMLAAVLALLEAHRETSTDRDAR